MEASVSIEIFAFIVAVFGLVVGSFLNVVIYRLPLMLNHEWLLHCKATLMQTQIVQEEVPEKLTLSFPNSHCPHCQHKIRFYENIPLFSYLFLRGRCSSCSAPISLQYPSTELVSMLLSTLIAWHFGFTWQAFAALFFTWGLVAHTAIDIRHQLLPDIITYPLLWLGLLCNGMNLFTDAQSSIIGAAVGYLSLWSLFHIFKLITGKEGMGYGDFKLLALIGAWGGWQILPVTVLFASIAGAILGAIILTVQKKGKQTPLPFGPYLAIAGWIAFLWGAQINALYLGFL